MSSPDAVVVGSGPNGLAAAVTLARAGLKVHVLERAATFGGGTRTQELTLPGFRHDVCSAVHPLALESPFFRRFALSQRVEFAVPEVSFGQPLHADRAALAYRDLDRTVAELGRDGPAYRRLIGPLAARAEQLATLTGAPLLPVPRHPLVAARLGAATLEQGTALWRARFADDAAPALLSGSAAHPVQPLPSLGAAGAGLGLTAFAHARGWPIPIGGSQAIADAMVADIRAHGGEVIAGVEVASLDELADARAVLFDTSARDLVRIVGERAPESYRSAVRRFRFGNGVAKIDFALSEPVPWANRDLRRAGTVHVGGASADVARAEREVAHGRHPSRPYVLVSQPSLFDATRAPEGRHVLWTYTHVPAGSAQDRTEAVIARLERFAPGFRDTILASASMTAQDVAAYNPNYVGGDISSGAVTVTQMLRRPVLSSRPWRTPVEGVYLCSSAAAPGPGVHGMVGWHAARDALEREFGIAVEPDLSPTAPAAVHDRATGEDHARI